MTSVEIEKEIRTISEKMNSLNKDMPEMTGMDWASEHGWISPAEHEAAEGKSRNNAKLQDAEVEKIEALRREHPQAMDDFLGAHIDRLKDTRAELDRLSAVAADKKLEFAMRFNLTLLPDLISCLSSWRRKKETKHWPAWMWRLAFSIGEESHKFIARERNKE